MNSAIGSLWPVLKKAQHWQLSKQKMTFRLKKAPVHRKRQRLLQLLQMQKADFGLVFSKKAPKFAISHKQVAAL